MKFNILMSKGNEDLFPKKAHPSDAGFDLQATHDSIIKSRQRAIISTGVSIELQEGFEAQIRSRSGLAFKKGIMVLNSPGTIDANYRGEIKIVLYNSDDNDFKITRGDRIAQMIINKLVEVELSLTQSLNQTDRGANGFGSTGV